MPPSNTQSLNPSPSLISDVNLVFIPRPIGSFNTLASVSWSPYFRQAAFFPQSFTAAASPPPPPHKVAHFTFRSLQFTRFQDSNRSNQIHHLRTYFEEAFIYTCPGARIEDGYAMMTIQYVIERILC
eukprot:1131537-Pleurochrysis_carterae.AAC.1